MYKARQIYEKELFIRIFSQGQIMTKAYLVVNFVAASNWSNIAFAMALAVWAGALPSYGFVLGRRPLMAVTDLTALPANELDWLRFDLKIRRQDVNNSSDELKY